MKNFVLGFIGVMFVLILLIYGFYAFLIVKAVDVAPEIYNDIIKKDTTIIMNIDSKGDTTKTITIQ